MENNITDRPCEVAAISPEFLSQFPKLPEYQGVWWPVYWTPIAGSGERITVFVVAVGKDGQICVRHTMRQETLEGIFGAKAAGLAKMFSLVQIHIEAFLSVPLDFSQWAPPL